MNIRKLIESFQTDDGLPENIFWLAYNFIGETLGQKAQSVFSFMVDATDGRFYIQDKFVDPYGYILIAAHDWDTQRDNTDQVVIYTGQNSHGLKIKE